MSDLQRRSGSRPSRRARERRAYNLAVAGGVLGIVFVVGAILAIAGVLGWPIPILAAILAVVCALLFRRTIS
jgi:CHASE2 domain-containing sensor protein